MLWPAAKLNPHFRLLCGLLALFWAGMVLLGVVRLAGAAPAASSVPRPAAAVSVVRRCPMCGATPGTKCRCCSAGPRAACLSNLKQIGLALTQYVQDTDEKYPQEHPATSNPAVDDDNGQLEGPGDDYGSPFEKIMPYVATASPNGSASLTQQLFVCPDDSDPHGIQLNTTLPGCTSTAPAPGITSYLINAYFLFGATLAQVSEPSSTIYIAERDKQFCDVHIHPWLGEIYNGPPPAAVAACVPNPDSLYAPASERHTDGANYGFADGHAKWERYDVTVQPTTEQPCFGQYQAF